MHAVNDVTKNPLQNEPTEIVFFDEGTVVFWNATPAVVSLYGGLLINKNMW